MASDGSKRAGAWLERTGTFRTLQAEVGMRVPAAPWVESVPRGTLFPALGLTPQWDVTQSFQGCVCCFRRQTHETSPHTGQDGCKGWCWAIPTRPSSPHCHLGGLASCGAHGAGGRGWGAFQLGAPPIQLLLRQERRRTAAGIAKHSPAPCLRLVFANVTRVQE